MKKLSIIMAALLLFAANASAAFYDYNAGVYKITNTASGGVELSEVTSGIQYKVLTINTDTAPTIYQFGDFALTQKDNPVTDDSTPTYGTNFDSDTLIKFRSTASTVDLIVNDTAGGFTAVVRDFSPNMHRVVIDERENVVHTGVSWYTCSDASEVNTGITFGYDTTVHEFYAENITAATLAGGKIDFGLDADGTGGDADGFVVDWNPDTTGYLAMTLASQGAYLDNGSIWYPNGHQIDGTDDGEITYTCDAAAAAAAGYFHYVFSVTR